MTPAQADGIWFLFSVLLGVVLGWTARGNGRQRRRFDVRGVVRDAWRGRGE